MRERKMGSGGIRRWGVFLVVVFGGWGKDDLEVRRDIRRVRIGGHSSGYRNTQPKFLKEGAPNLDQAIAYPN